MSLYLYKGDGVNSVPGVAGAVRYDNTTSGSSATTVQDELDKIEANGITFSGTREEVEAAIARGEFKNGDKIIITDDFSGGGGGGNSAFIGTTAEVNAAISSGEIKEGMEVIITDDTESYNPTASDVSYDNTTSELESSTVQNAIDELNSTLTEIKKGKYSMPNLDYGNPLFTFDANNLSYTAIKDCYLVGQLSRKSSTGKTTLSINNNIISTSSFNTGSGEIVTEQLLLKISKDDEVTISGYFEETLYIFDIITD